MYDVFVLSWVFGNIEKGLSQTQTHMAVRENIAHRRRSSISFAIGLRCLDMACHLVIVISWKINDVRLHWPSFRSRAKFWTYISLYCSSLLVVYLDDGIAMPFDRFQYMICVLPAESIKSMLLGLPYARCTVKSIGPTLAYTPPLIAATIFGTSWNELAIICNAS